MSSGASQSTPAAADAGYLAHIERIRAEILSPTVRAGFDHWVSLLRGRCFPMRREIAPTAIARQLLHVSLIDVRNMGAPFTARLVGEYVRKRQGIGPGTRIAEQVGVEQARDRVMARLTMCVEQRRPIRGLYLYRPLDKPRVRLWVEAAACPLSDDGETIDCIVTFGADHDFKPPPGAREWP
ncbi:MAG: hypothetical protein ACT4N4_07010 [Rhodospirillales bacterium]